MAENFAEYNKSPKDQETARHLIEKYERLQHIEIDDILFLSEANLKPKAYAKCYQFGDHPILHFTEKAYAIVVYESNVDHMTEPQRNLLILHELLHIGTKASKLRDHTVKDFRSILGIGGLGWAEEGAVVPNILKEGDQPWK